MTELQRPNQRPDIPPINGFDHIHLYCGNAKSAAGWYIARFGFEPFAYKGLETNSRDIATHVIKLGKVIIALSNPLNPEKTLIGDEVAICGDFVKDIAFEVDDAKAIYNKAIERGAKSFQAPTTLKDENGTVVIATVHTYGNVVHSFIERKNYNGTFLPGFISVTQKDPINLLLPSINVNFIDHVVGNTPDNGMTPAVEWYAKILNFHRFWTVDDSQVHTEYSALKSTVVCDYDRNVRLPINEPAIGKKKSQILEYVEYYGGAGVQHVAINTSNLIETVQKLKKRGVDFLPIPKSYYQDLRIRLQNSPVNVVEDLNKIEELNILIDFDDQGYLLQLFTRPVQDRPTLFYEFIQRENHEGFGAGNFKSLFESIERDQDKRGNLVDL